MRKPQERDDFYIKNDYPEAVRTNYELITENIDQLTREYLDQMIDGIYKDAYMDGFKDAMFYMEG